MTEDFLAKEKGFRQLNKQLEQKACDLVKKVEHIINTYDNGCSIRDSKTQYRNFMNVGSESTENAIARKEDNLQVSVKRNASLPYIFNQDSSSKSRIEAQRNHDDEISLKGNLANKTIVNLLKTKIDVLQSELHKVHVEYKKKCNSYKDLELEHKRLEVKSQNEIETLKDTIKKLENSNKELQCQCQAQNTENSIITKDLDKLQKQVKSLAQQSSNYSTRLNRSLESNDKLKNALKCSQMEEKELRNQIRRLQEGERLTVNNLGKQLSELIQVFRKQMLLIDSLKKQNACLMVIKQLNFTKEDFSRLLEPKT